MTSLAAFVLPALLQMARVAITGDGLCPTLAEIDRSLDDLAPRAATPSESPPREPPTSPTVHVSRAPGLVRLELTGADSQLLARRDLATTGTCPDLATAAAIVIATWQSDLDPKASLAVLAPPPKARPEELVVAAPVAAPPVSAPLPFSLGIGLLASVADSSVAPGAELRGSVELPASRLALEGILGGTTSRSTDVGTYPGAARWTRGWLALGPGARVVDGGTRLDLHAQALLGLLHVEGVALSRASSDTRLDVGVGGGVALSRKIAGASIWLGIDLLVWPSEQRLIIQGITDEGRLPQFDLQLAAGMSLGRGR